MLKLLTKESISLLKNFSKKHKSAKEMLKLGEQNVYEHIKTCGLAPKKAKAIIETSKILKKNIMAKFQMNYRFGRIAWRWT